MFKKFEGSVLSSDNNNGNERSFNEEGIHYTVAKNERARRPFWPLRLRRLCILSCCWLNLPIRSAFQQHPKPSQSCFMQLLTNLFSVVTRLLCFRIFVWQFENERKTLIWIMFTYHVVSFIWDRPIFKEGWVLCISNTAQVELLAI